MTMSPGIGPLIDPRRLLFLEPVSRLYTTSPFDPAWEELERTAMRIGSGLHPGLRSAEPSSAPGPVGEHGERRSSGGELTENLRRMSEAIGTAVAATAGALEQGVGGTDHELTVYRGAALYRLFDEYGAELQRLIDEDGVDVPFHDAFLARYRSLFRHRGMGLSVPEPSHLLALFYQARRAWYFASTKILGGSKSARAARLAIWRANLARDACAYAGGLYRVMDEIPVLITGETGTGKELAAECVAWSRYIPFDAGARRFVRRPREDYHRRNFCEVPDELVESALFGHKRGSFTGATADSPGFFGLPRANGSLLLDEVGEIPRHVQAKLLRPIQNREYTPVGDNHPREIQGRLMFATHRDLEIMCREDTFRPDLLERMNGAHVHMPSLGQILAEAPGELRTYVRAFVGKRIDPPEQAEAWTETVVASIHAQRPHHPWRRNLRELQHYTERCLLGDADPLAPAPATTTPASPPAATTTPPPSSEILGRRAKAGEVTLDEVARAYVTCMYALTGENASETARRAKIDRKKVSRLLDFDRLARWLRGRT
jgi:transcriptional regulator with AAA-type ATPase domain